MDANILVSVLNKEYPLFTYSARILSLAADSDYKVYTSPLCLAIAFYFSEKKSGRREARRKIALLSSKISITDNTKSDVTQTLKNVKINDFEDGLQYYAALSEKCSCILTEDVSDFHFSEIEVLSSQGFFEKYLG